MQREDWGGVGVFEKRSACRNYLKDRFSKFNSPELTDADCTTWRGGVPEPLAEELFGGLDVPAGRGELRTNNRAI